MERKGVRCEVGGCFPEGKMKERMSAKDGRQEEGTIGEAKSFPPLFQIRVRRQALASTTFENLIFPPLGLHPIQTASTPRRECIRRFTHRRADEARHKYRTCTTLLAPQSLTHSHPHPLSITILTATICSSFILYNRPYSSLTHAN